ncbi:MAG: hypothetical protein J6A28_02270 [Clostridia bacterium]|nr:hypothetical protein [Clostridia bacterium]
MKESIEKIEQLTPNKPQGILKSIGKALKRGFVTFLTSLIIVGTAATIAGNIQLKDYSSSAQVQQLSEEFGADMGYAYEKFGIHSRMQHNGDEPIYVCFNEELPSESRASAIKSLDYLFGLVGQINPAYRYEIVSQEEFDRIWMKTKIYYEFGEHENAEAHIVHSYNPLSLFTSKPAMQGYEVRQSKAYNFENLDYIYLHELLHAFGIDDVYTQGPDAVTNKFQGNTSINSNIGYKHPFITPNDFKLLVALYAPKFENAQEQAKQTARLQQMIEVYTKHYYEDLSVIYKETFKIDEHLEKQDFNFTLDSTFLGAEQTEYNYTYDITLQGDSYAFKLYDDKHNLLDSCNGKVYWNNDVAFLQDVTLKEGLYPGWKDHCFSGGYVQDFAFIKRNGKICFANFVAETYWEGKDITFLDEELER